MSGKTIGRYEIRGELGRGGMATVYLAYDPTLEREVALKVLPTYFAHEPEFSARFAREAKTVAALEHNAIVALYDYGEEGEWPYFVMQLMKGGSLKDKLEQGALSLAEAGQVLRRVGSALDKAHSRNLIHRDLKPGNILFDEDNDAYLTDFGIVKLAEKSENYTQTGNTLGTPAYMSPEQARGLEEIDARSDIYALGIILYEMLTGDVPYKSETTVGQAMMHIMEPIPQILEVKADLPSAIQIVIDRAMAKKREDRYATAGELAVAVMDIANGKATAVVAPIPAAEISLVAEPAVKEAAAEATAVATPPPLIEKAPEPAPQPVTPTPLPATAAIPAAIPAVPPVKKGGIPKWVYAVVALVLIFIIAIFALFDDGGGDAVQLPAEPILFGTSIRASLNSDEIAIYTFSGNANDVVEVIVAPLTDDLDVILDVLDSNGRSLVGGEIDDGLDGQTETLSNQRLPGMGEYTIAISSYGTGSGSFIVTLELISENGQ